MSQSRDACDYLGCGKPAIGFVAYSGSKPEFKGYIDGQPQWLEWRAYYCTDHQVMFLAIYAVGKPGSSAYSSKLGEAA